MYIALLFPKIITLLFVFVGFSHTNSLGLNNFFPLIDLMSIYYWSLYRPNTMQNWFVFVMGLLVDVVSGGPIGLNALLNLLLRGAVLYKGNYVKKSFAMVWQSFALLLAVIISIKWLVFSTINSGFPVIDSAIMQLLLSVLLYPLFHSMFNVVNVNLPRSRSDA
jgi:rod shape-determining protein MreD